MRLEEDKKESLQLGPGLEKSLVYITDGLLFSAEKMKNYNDSDRHIVGQGQAG